jgi:hypothetical protein
MCLYPFARTNVFSAKNMCFAIWARDGAGWHTQFLNLSHHVLSVDDWPGDATFFLWGQPLKIIRKYSAKKRSSPLRLDLFESLFWLVKLNICVYPFARQMCLQLYKLWTSRSFEFSGLNGIVRVCLYFWPLYLHFAFRERPFWSFEPSFRLSRAPACHIKHAFGN